MTPTLQRLNAQGRALLQRVKPQSASVRNILKLAGGTAGSQLISVAAAPFLTRLYGPESFGVLATSVSILALLNVLSSLRYELAIPVPEDDDEAVALVWLSFVLVAISTGLTALGVLLLGDQLVIWLNEPALKPLLCLLPLGLLLSGVHQSLSYWAIRRKNFSLLALSKFYQGVSSVITSVLFFPLGAFGLFLSQNLGNLSGLWVLLKFGPSAILPPKSGSSEHIILVFKRYSGFGLYGLPAGIVSAVGSQLPIILFSIYFPPGDVGQLVLAQRFFSLPATLVTASIAQVFFSSALEYRRAGDLGSYVTRLALKIFPYSLCFSIFIGFLLAPFVNLFFGKQWTLLEYILPLLIPMVVGEACVNTFSTAFAASENNHLSLVANIASTSSRIGSFFLAVLFKSSFLSTILFFSVGSLLGYCIYGLILLFALRQSFPEVSRQ